MARSAGLSLHTRGWAQGQSFAVQAEVLAVSCRGSWREQKNEWNCCIWSQIGGPCNSVLSSQTDRSFPGFWTARTGEPAVVYRTDLASGAVMSQHHFQALPRG